MADSDSTELDVLLVEDNPGDRDLILEYLEQSGRAFQTETAGSLASAFEILNDKMFNAVFLDLGLPDSIGLDTLQRFISDSPGVPVIVLTGLDDEQLGIDAIRIGAQDYLVKGTVNTNLLLRSLRHAIEREGLNVKLKQYNRMLGVIRSINQLIVREKNANLLIGSICNLLIQDGHYLHAWITLFDVTGKSSAFAQAGLGDEACFIQAQLLRGEMPHCCGKTMGHTNVVLIRERALNCSTCPLSQKNSSHYGAAVGLMHGKRSFGVLVLAIPSDTEYSEDELSLIREFALDIGLALYGIEQNEKNFRAEKALQASERKHRGFLDNLNTAVVAHAPDTAILYCNQKALDYMGLTMEQMLGKKAIDPQWNFLNEDESIMAPDDFPVNRALKSRTGLKHYVVGIIRSDTDRVTWLACNSHRVMGADNGLASVLLSFIDITETRQALKELQASKQKFQSMVNNIGIGVVLINKNMEIIELNQTMREWFPELNDIDISQRPVCYSVIQNPPKDTICEDCPTFKTLKDGSVNELMKERSVGGRVRNHRIVSSPILNDEDKVIGAIEMVEDITERLQLEGQLRQSQKFEAIGTLAGGIAHDFNNILSAILGFSELALADVDKGTELEEDLSEIYAAGKRAKDLVNQILTFARQTDEDLKPVQVCIIAKEVVKFIRSSIPASIQIKDSIKSKSLVMGSATQIHQIFMNLCTNAAFAMEDQGGVLEITVKDVRTNVGTEAADHVLEQKDYIQIKVADTGEGISDQIINSIFEPYFTTKPQGEGTGMGLAVIHGIVEKYGGKVAVESTLGQGTVFTVYLPINKKTHVYTFDKTEEFPSGREKILLVDDEAPIAAIGQRLLESMGYCVITRTSSIEALELFRSNPTDFDLVITDMAMPSMAGDRMASELMAIRPDIPVILCTGYSRRISKGSAAAMGIKALLYKPVVKSDIARTVRKVLEEAKVKSYDY